MLRISRPEVSADAGAPKSRAIGLIGSVALHGVAIALAIYFAEPGRPTPLPMVNVTLVAAEAVDSSKYGAAAGSDQAAVPRPQSAAELKTDRKLKPEVQPPATPAAISRPEPSPPDTAPPQPRASPQDESQPAVAAIGSISKRVDLPVPGLKPRRRPTARTEVTPADPPDNAPAPQAPGRMQGPPPGGTSSTRNADGPAPAERQSGAIADGAAPRTEPGNAARASITARGVAISPPRVPGSASGNAIPRYPFLARRQGQEGRVLLVVEVGVAGTVQSVLVSQSSGFRLLDAAAIKAVRTWRFIPATRGGIDVAGRIDVPIAFKLKQ